MVTRNVNIMRSIDWITVLLYLLLVACGWLSICGASYDYGQTDFFSFSSRSGKQLMWICCSGLLGFVLLMLDSKFYKTFAYLIYMAMILLLMVTIVIATDVKGSRSWLHLGPVSLQPAEFAKFATALALAKFISRYNFSMKKLKDVLGVSFLIFLPLGLIILQRETGSALVYFAFIVMLYREGMPGIILLSGVCAVLYFVLSLRFSEVFIGETPTVMGQYIVMLLIQFFTSIMYGNYFKQWRVARMQLIISALCIALATWISLVYFPFNIVWVQLALVALFVVYALYQFLLKRYSRYLIITLFPLLSVGFLFSTNYVFNNILEAHQQVRIKVLLGLKQDLSGAGYNVNQSKIAIGSGGFIGKGFLNGTQTKLKYVPEQDTDFIFCTVGEEQGFLGSSFVLLLFLTLILRLIYLSERQHDTFCRVYGYALVSILLFHVFINIGMVLGLTPVIGIPLPFFSYGGSSLWGFCILLFIFLRLDAARSERLR
ncbi:MAG: rod shape-determining protein RodA [Bacteroidaceae bacterium]|nr:rod shape-determining protein RodA [Bacteroidaceae bacterium]